MHAEILARTSEGWEWRDDRVPVDGAFDSPSEAVEAGVEALEEEVEAGRMAPDEAADLAADARFELGANEHHLGGSDAGALEALSRLEDELRSRA